MLIHWTEQNLKYTKKLQGLKKHKLNNKILISIEQEFSYQTNILRIKNTFFKLNLKNITKFSNSCFLTHDIWNLYLNVRNLNSEMPDTFIVLSVCIALNNFNYFASENVSIFIYIFNRFTDPFLKIYYKPKLSSPNVFIHLLTLFNKI